MFQGNSPQARSIAGALSQKLQQLKNNMQDALVNQVRRLLEYLAVRRWWYKHYMKQYVESRLPNILHHSTAVFSFFSGFLCSDSWQ